MLLNRKDMIKPNNYYDIILPNEEGRKYTVRYKQYMYSDIEGECGIPGFELNNFGCGITAIASILSSLGFDLDPVSVAKIMLLDDNNNPLDFYTNKEKGRMGLTTISFIYLLQELKNRLKLELEYKLVKVSYTRPELKKDEVIEMISNEFMSLILVGARGKIEHPRTFSNYGHYIALTSVNNKTHEFYVVNPNKLGDTQIDTTFSYEEILANMYSNTFDFLCVRKLK